MTTVEEILEDSPIFLTLGKSDLILTVAIIALSMTDQDEAFALLPELPEDLDHAITLMDLVQKELILCWLTQRIKEI